jgi:hypothetical protein
VNPPQWDNNNWRWNTVLSAEAWVITNWLDEGKRYRMLKKTASFVLASFRGSTYGKEVRFASSLAAVALDSLFEHPARRSGAVRGCCNSSLG